MENVIKLIILGILITIITLIVVDSLSTFSPPTNEAAAISGLRTISSAQELYYHRCKRFGNMTELHKMDAIDAVLAEATTPEKSKSGYYFTMTLYENGWSCVAIPAKPGYTGERSFFINKTGIIRAEPCRSTNDPLANENSLTPAEWSKKQAKELRDR